MIHELHDLYSHEGKYYTVEALNEKVGYDITEFKYAERMDRGFRKVHRICDYNKPNRASFEYYTTEGVKVGWQYGERYFFDTEEERDEQREIYRRNREESKYRNELLKQIKELATEELEKIVAQIEK